MRDGKTCKQVIFSIFATLVLQHTLDLVNFPSCHRKAAVQTALRDSVTTFIAYGHTLKHNYIFLLEKMTLRSGSWIAKCCW